MTQNATTRVAPEKADFRPALSSRPHAGSSPEKTMATYSDYRAQWKHPEWQKKRLLIMNRAGWECENCGDKETTLNVHHKRYIKGRKVWEYDDDLLQCLCEPCHEQEHDGRELLNMIVASSGLGGLDAIIGLACGYLDAVCDIDPGLAHMGYESHAMFYELGMAAAALETRGLEAWRQVVRDHVKNRPSTPAMRGKVELWDDKDK